MVALSSPPDKPIRAQIAETVSIVASMDFPEQWPDLIDVSDLPSLIHHTKIQGNLAFGAIFIS